MVSRGRDNTFKILGTAREHSGYAVSDSYYGSQEMWFFPTGVVTQTGRLHNSITPGQRMSEHHESSFLPWYCDLSLTGALHSPLFILWKFRCRHLHFRMCYYQRTARTKKALPSHSGQNSSIVMQKKKKVSGSQAQRVEGMARKHENMSLSPRNHKKARHSATYL